MNMSDTQYITISNFINDIMVKMPYGFKDYYFIYFENFKIRISKGRNSMLIYKNEERIFRVSKPCFYDQYSVDSINFTDYSEFFQNKEEDIFKLLAIIDIYNLKNAIKTPNTEKRKVHKL